MMASLRNFGLRFLPISSAILLACMIAGCGGKENIGELRDIVTERDLMDCENQMELVFPKDVEAIGIWQKEEPNASIKLKLVMDHEDARRLLDNSPFRGKPLVGANNAAFGPNVQWWDPGKSNLTYIGHTVLSDEVSELTIGVNDANPKRTVIYLAWTNNEGLPQD